MNLKGIHQFLTILKLFFDVFEDTSHLLIILQNALLEEELLVFLVLGIIVSCSQVDFILFR